jgi:4-hydroxybutyryl-CoA dehydratase/vinylacetyl-CoA-Delta-isomerase
LATDIAGVVGNVPSAKDMDDPVAGLYQENAWLPPGVDVVDRMKVLRLIENIVAGAGAVAYLIEIVHGAGSPMASAS